MRILKDNQKLREQFAQQNELKKEHDQLRETQIKSTINVVKKRVMSELDF